MTEPAADPRRAARRDAGRPRGANIVDAVLAGTLAELADHGLSGLNVERVARRAEVNKTTIYRRWPTRDALVAAALERVLIDVEAGLLIPGADLRADLLAIVRPLADVLSTDLGRAVMRAAMGESESPAVRELVRRRLHGQTTSPMDEIVSRARRRGEWGAEMNGDEVVFTLVGALMHRALLEQAPLSADWLDRLVEMVARGVR